MHTSMLDHCMLLPPNWDDYLLDILETLAQDARILNKAIVTKEAYLRRRLNVEDDRVAILLSKINQYTSKMKNVRISEKHYSQVVEQHTQTATLLLGELIILHDHSQQLLYNPVVRTKLDDAIRAWKDVTTNILKAQTEKEEEVILPDMDVDEFLDMLFNARWVTDSENEMNGLVNADIPPEKLIVCAV